MLEVLFRKLLPTPICSSLFPFFWLDWGLNSGFVIAKQTHTSSSFCSGYFGDGGLVNYLPWLVLNLDLLISASWVARVAGLSHWCSVPFFSCNSFTSFVKIFDKPLSTFYLFNFIFWKYWSLNSGSCTWEAGALPLWAMPQPFAYLKVCVCVWILTPN
jgi:hypothetical protein